MENVLSWITQQSHAPFSETMETTLKNKQRKINLEKKNLGGRENSHFYLLKLDEFYIINLPPFPPWHQVDNLL